MKQLSAALLLALCCLAVLGGCSTSCAGGSNRGVFCGTGTRF